MLRREELRQKEKEAEKAAEAFFKRAAQYEGRSGLFEAQQSYDAMPLWKRIFFKRDESIQATAQKFNIFAENCRKKGKEAQTEARNYAEQGFKIALAHSEARDQEDNLAIARIEARRREEQQREQERQEEARKQAKKDELEKKYGAAIRKIVCPNVPSVAHTHVEYKQYIDKLTEATPEQRFEMVKRLQHAEHRYEVQELFYSVAKIVSCDTSISGRERARDEMLKKWDRAMPEQRKQMEQDAKVFVEKHQRQRSRSGPSMGR